MANLPNSNLSLAPWLPVSWAPTKLCHGTHFFHWKSY
jgi:hypothetical protein